jgi:hypothetical protein
VRVSRDRPFLQSLLVVLDTRDATLRQDEYRAWRLVGKRGHVYGVPEADAYYAFAQFPTARGWTAAKIRLRFGQVTQDGDDEGVIRFTGLPTPEQAEAIRITVGLPRRRHLSPEQRARLRSIGRPFKPRGPGG